MWATVSSRAVSFTHVHMRFINDFEAEFNTSIKLLFVSLKDTHTEGMLIFLL